jgi:hypothetical protein
MKRGAMTKETYLETAKDAWVKACNLRKPSAKYSMKVMAQQSFCKILEVGRGDKFHTKQSYNSIRKLGFTFIVPYF